MRVYNETKTEFWDEPHLRDSLLKTNNWLVEEYYKTDTQFFEHLLDTLLQVLSKNVDINNLYEESEQCRVGFELVPNSTDISNYRFDPSLGMTIISINEYTISKLILDPDFKKLYLREMIYKIVHEDTHKQQFDRYDGFNKNYTYPTKNAFKMLSQKDVDYFSQTIEADAYGREVGEIIIQQYGSVLVDDIFNDIVKGDCPQIQEYLQVYRDPRIPKKAFQHFWRSLYDYLKGEEVSPLPKKDLQEFKTYSDYFKAVRPQKLPSQIRER